MKERPWRCSFVGILFILLIHAIFCDARKVFRQYRTKSKNITNGDDSCETSPVQQNVTLQGGIRAGYFHKLAEFVAMELCVQLCCQEKGCDVAFMIDKNCYGVKCFSEELCRVVPAKNAPRALMITKVDFRGEVYLQKFMPERLRCFQTSVEHNVTLIGGLRAGNFTAVGHIENLDACAKLCCVRENCDLALMVKRHCFMVQCLDKERCKSAPVINQEFHTHVVRVNRSKVLANEQQTVHALISGSEGKPSQLMCKNGAVLYNQTLLGGYDAGKFKPLSHSTNMSACIRLCCGEMTCDVALMIERKCYGVVCKTRKLCETIPAKNSAMLNHLRPKISYITSRNEEVNSIMLQTRNEICKANVISYDVTLRGGRHAGKYKAFGRVDDMTECIRVCCMEKYCDLAFMINATCFTVRCYSDESCREMRSLGSEFKSMLSYVIRERPKTHHKLPGKLHGNTLQHKDYRKGAHNNSTKYTNSTEAPHVPSPSSSNVDGDQYCTRSDVMYNVTLRGGVASGKFRDSGILSSIQECLRICCNAKSCDIAFMLSDHCFSVTCSNQTLCEVVTARSNRFNPRVAYIYARSNITSQDPKFTTHQKKLLSQKASLLSKHHIHKNTYQNNHTTNSTNQNTNKDKPKKAKRINKMGSSKHKKRLKHAKSSKGTQKQHRKLAHSNRAKLKQMYAQERRLLRKLSLLKLRMEMLKRGEHGGESKKDNVLVEAFEDEPNTTEFSINTKSPRQRKVKVEKGTSKEDTKNALLSEAFEDDSMVSNTSLFGNVTTLPKNRNNTKKGPNKHEMNNKALLEQEKHIKNRVLSEVSQGNSQVSRSSFAFSNKTNSFHQSQEDMKKIEEKNKHGNYSVLLKAFDENQKVSKAISLGKKTKPYYQSKNNMQNAEEKTNHAKGGVFHEKFEENPVKESKTSSHNNNVTFRFELNKNKMEKGEGTDKPTKDSVLLAAFEEDIKLAKTSSYNNNTNFRQRNNSNMTEAEKQTSNAFFYNNTTQSRSPEDVKYNFPEQKNANMLLKAFEAPAKILSTFSNDVKAISALEYENKTREMTKNSIVRFTESKRKKMTQNKNASQGNNSIELTKVNVYSEVKQQHFLQNLTKYREPLKEKAGTTTKIFQPLHRTESNKNFEEPLRHGNMAIAGVSNAHNIPLENMINETQGVLETSKENNQQSVEKLKAG